MATHRKLSTLSLLVSCFRLGACGPRSRPDRSSPVPAAVGPALFNGTETVGDLRRDGVVAFGTAGNVVVSRVEAAGRSELVTLPGEGFPVILTSRGDDAVVVVTADEGIHVFDGAAVTDLHARLAGALILAHDPSLSIEALDLTQDGSIIIGATVGGQGDDAPYGQLVVPRGPLRDRALGDRLRA